MPAAAGWTVLALVFLDEVLAVWALAVVGRGLGGWPVALLLAGAGVGLWATFASPKAPLRGPVRSPVTKVVVFGAAVVGLVGTGHVAAGLALLAFSVVVNGVATAPSVRALVDERG